RLHFHDGRRGRLGAFGNIRPRIYPVHDARNHQYCAQERQFLRLGAKARGDELHFASTPSATVFASPASSRMKASIFMLTVSVFEPCCGAAVSDSMISSGPDRSNSPMKFSRLRYVPS